MSLFDPILKAVSSQRCVGSVFERNQSLKELLAPSLNPNKKIAKTNSITSFNNGEIWKGYNYFIGYNYLICITNRKYYTRAVLRRNCKNMIYW